MVRLMGAFLGAVLAVCVLTSAQAANDVSPEKKALVERYLELSGALTMMDQLEETFRRQFDAAFRKNQKSKITQNQRKKINDILIDEMKNMYDVTLNKMVPIFSEYFTVGELRELVAFMESPLGQKNVELIPKMMAEMMPLLTTETSRIQKRMRWRIMEILDEGG